MKENIEDQNQSGTLVEFASCFDLNRDLNLEERMVLLKELHKIYCVDYIHEIEDQGNYGVTGWDVTVLYKAKIDISEDELCRQFHSLLCYVVFSSIKTF